LWAIVPNVKTNPMPRGRKPNTSLTFLRQIDPSGGHEACWPWLGFRNPKGYGQSSINNKTILAHRWSYQHHHGVVISNALQVRHTCDNPSCCNPLHLLLGTNQNNVDDKMQRRRFRPKQTRFSQEDLDKMKQLRMSGISRDQIAKRFGCDKTTVAHHERLGFHKSNPHKS
jgi:hypothetical protein